MPKEIWNVRPETLRSVGILIALLAQPLQFPLPPHSPSTPHPRTPPPPHTLVYPHRHNTSGSSPETRQGVWLQPEDSPHSTIYYQSTSSSPAIIPRYTQMYMWRVLGRLKTQVVISSNTAHAPNFRMPPWELQYIFRQREINMFDSPRVAIHGVAGASGISISSVRPTTNKIVADRLPWPPRPLAAVVSTFPRSAIHNCLHDWPSEVSCFPMVTVKFVFLSFSFGSVTFNGIVLSMSFGTRDLYRTPSFRLPTSKPPMYVILGEITLCPMASERFNNLHLLDGGYTDNAS